VTLPTEALFLKKNKFFRETYFNRSPNFLLYFGHPQDIKLPRLKFGNPRYAKQRLVDGRLIHSKMIHFRMN
jgi:hypothetical protein